MGSENRPDGLKQRERRRYVTLAMLLATLLFPIGGGHLYVGSYRRALLFAAALMALAGTCVLFIIVSTSVVSDFWSDFFFYVAWSIVGAFVTVWAWEILDARSLCLKHNARITKAGPG